MRTPTYCPIPMPDGSDCWREPEPDGFAGICSEHMFQIAKAWVGDPVLQRIRCDECMQLAIVRDRLARLAVCQNCNHVTTLDYPIIDERRLGPAEPDPNYPTYRVSARTDVVYYVRFGDRIKIGTTTNLPQRLAQLPVDELLAIEPGNVSKEKARHREFARLLIPGQQEWFRCEPALLGHASAIRQRYGAPMSAWRSWSARVQVA